MLESGFELQIPGLALHTMAEFRYFGSWRSGKEKRQLRRDSGRPFRSHLGVWLSLHLSLQAQRLPWAPVLMASLQSSTWRIIQTPFQMEGSDSTPWLAMLNSCGCPYVAGYCNFSMVEWGKPSSHTQRNVSGVSIILASSDDLIESYSLSFLESPKSPIYIFFACSFPAAMHLPNLST